MGIWVFEEQRNGAIRRDPNEGELFKTEQAAEDEYAGNDMLVREILQNALDARSGAGPVRVRFAIHEAGDAPRDDRLAHYFERLRAPLSLRQVDYDANGVPSLPCRFLVCEDFGTTGLEGNPLLHQDPPIGEKPGEFFFWFWRNIGRSGKTGDDLGRWGLGKIVYRSASRAGCMFGLTVRESDRRRLLMGQAVLKIHQHNNQEYVPEGFWCSGKDANDLPLPLEDTKVLSRFCKEWHLSRKNEPGLSVVSPYIPHELRPDRLLQAAAVHFFMRIVRGELVVEVAGPGIGTVTLDQAGIEAACKKIVWDGPKRTKRHVAPPIAFAKTCSSSPPTVTTKVLGMQKLPELDESALPEQTIHDLRHRFAAGERIGVRVQMNLPRRQGPSKEGHLDVYLQRADEGSRCDTYYIREGMTITKINSRAATRGIQSLVIVDKGPLAELLGDTEGPAHEDWDTSQERPDRTWKTWKGRVKFVRGIVDSMVELLTPPNTEPDFDLLSDFFSIEFTGGSQRQPQPGKDKKKPPEFPPIQPNPKWFHITSRSGGFTVSRNTEVPMPKKPTLKVSVAYDLPRGDPLKNWSPLDFSIGNGDGALKPKGKGVKAELVKGNIVTLKSPQQEFSFSVDGFDIHRDLFVRVDDVSNGEEEQQ